MRCAAVLLSLTGCSLAFHATPSSRCDAGEPFGVGRPIDAMGLSVEAARFTRDEDIAYLSLCPVDPDGNVDKGACDLYFAPYDRSKRSLSVFPMTGVSSDCYDAYPTITADGKHILYASERPSPGGEGCGPVNIWIATSVDGTFSEPELTPFAGAPAGRCANEPYVLGDGGQSVYFSTVVCDAGDSDLDVTNGAPPNYSSLAEPITAANTTQQEFAPVVTEDEEELFFARGTSLDDLDIYQARRAKDGEPFGAPVKASEVSSTEIDWPVWISEDACRLYYIKKPANAKRATLFVASRTP